MKKLRLVLGVSCALVIAAGCIAASSQKQPERDARIIVEVNRKLETLNKEGIKRTQNVVYDNIKQYATTNVRRIQSYSQLNNAFVVEVNSGDIEAIKKVPGVASVTVDEIHWVRNLENDGAVTLGDGQSGSEDLFGGSENISAETMNKPENTSDGEGTIVAILDNEFHLKGKVKSTPGWHHEVYEPLPADCAVRYTFDTINQVVGLNAADAKPSAFEGDEGSRYLNTKVPFYFDYGGTSKIYGKTGTPKYDVHSEMDYHGSHVSSITAANAPTYKGIAPKAQLALMKVFTEYDAKGLGDKLGFTSYSGAYDTVVLSALEDCITLGVDGINMSLGSDLDDFDCDSITMKTLSKLANGDPAKGIKPILTSISAGNAGKTSFSTSGAYANWSRDTIETGILGSYAKNADVMTIASGHATKIFYENAFQTSIGGVSKTIAFDDQIVNREGSDDDYPREYRVKDLYNSVDPLEWVYVPGFGTSADYSGLRVEGKLAVVNRGSTSFADKYSVAASKGAAGLIIINNDPTASSFSFRCSFGDGFNPTMPCALVLYKDKTFFSTNKTGSFGIIYKQVDNDDAAKTISEFSSDGARFDLDLKPEITTPGDNIRGAVPEHAMSNLTKEEKESPTYKYKCYQYLSGTSMAAPNYAGAQALLLSKVAGPIYHEAYNNFRDVTNAELEEIDEFKQTINMRLMSTASPMNDYVENPETKVKSITSPRIQGAGMVDLDGAFKTDVYLEGFEVNKDNEKVGLKKAKINLRNNPDIANGNINLSFFAYNESNENREFDVKFSVMRPALATPNDFVTKEYNFKGEIDNIENLSGASFYDYEIKEMAIASGDIAYKDAYKVTKDIEYFATEEDYLNYVHYSSEKINGQPNPDFDFDKAAEYYTVIEKGFYYNASETGVDYQPLPSYLAQSTMDVLIDEVSRPSITLQPGKNEVNIPAYSLSEEVKAEILRNYEYGCMIEGYVTLTSKNDKADLSIPYLGFYSGTDVNAGASYDTAPVAEPFSFEKDYTKVYPSDLVNDVSKSLIGKDNVNFESMIVTGYAERPQNIDTNGVVKNNTSFDKLTGFSKVGTNPLTGEATADASNDIYVGNPKTSNTMIIQQFMLRSVVDNYFTITNKATGEVVHTDALQDFLFGTTMGKWSLFKSHVDPNYLGAGYVAHRAVSIVPLYNEATGEAFASGEYELKFNYQLMGTLNWVSKSYTLHIDSESPVVKTISQYRDNDGVERVRIFFQEAKLSHAYVGNNIVDEVFYDDANKLYYIDLTAEFVIDSINQISKGNNKRLFIGAIDYARGESGCIVKPKDINNFNAGFSSIQGDNITIQMDFTYENNVLVIKNRNGQVLDFEGKILLNGFPATYVPPTANNTSSTSSKSVGNDGLLIGLIVAIPAAAIILGSLAYILSKKRKGER